jgi:hypothetical protein
MKNAKLAATPSKRAASNVPQDTTPDKPVGAAAAKATVKAALAKALPKAPTAKAVAKGPKAKAAGGRGVWNPTWSLEKTRAQALGRTGLHGKGQSLAFTYAEYGSMANAIKAAERWVARAKRTGKP